MEYNIIGDIAGNYNTLLALLDKMPKTATLLSLGDMCDRGPNSKEVLYFIKENGLAVLGNHDHMLLDTCRNKGVYNDGVWFYNGGDKTVQSFFKEEFEKDKLLFNECDYTDKFPEDILVWLESLPLYLELEENKNKLKGFISHAPKRPDWNLELSCDLAGDGRNMSHIDNTIIWNRGSTRRLKDSYQVFGHNSHWGLEKQSDKQGEYGICLDTSRDSILTGMHWPSMTIYQQEYIDE